MQGRSLIMGLSGGMDSTSLLYYALDQGYTIYPVSFTYDSKHNFWENEAAKRVHAHTYTRSSRLGLLINFDVTPVFNNIKSDLLKSSEHKIPEGHYAAENMKSTVVPGRNLVFASIMASFAESMNAQYVGLGVHSGDHYIYPDCRPEFIGPLNETIMAQSENQVGMFTPFIGLGKSSILHIGNALGAPFHLTRTCYNNQEVACGKCGSCQERLEAYALAGLEDPIKYESRELIHKNNS